MQKLTIGQMTCLNRISENTLRECLEKQNRYLLSQKRALEIPQYTASKPLQSLDAHKKYSAQKSYTIKRLPRRRVLCLASEHPYPAWATAFRSVEVWEYCLRALLDRLEEDGYEIAGDYVGEVVAESTTLGAQRRKMLVKMQVPIRAASRKPGDGHIDIAERL